MTWIYLLVAYGLCFGIQNKLTFLRRIAFFKALVSCTYCLGTHCGWMVWILAWAVEGRMPAVVPGNPEPVGLAILASLAVWAMAGAAFCYALDAVVRWLETRSA